MDAEKEIAWVEIKVPRAGARLAVIETLASAGIELRSTRISGLVIQGGVALSQEGGFKNLIGRLALDGFVESFEFHEAWRPLCLGKDRTLPDILEALSREEVELREAWVDREGLTIVVPAHRAAEVMKMGKHG